MTQLIPQHIPYKSIGLTDYFQVPSQSSDLPHIVWIHWRYDLKPSHDNDFVHCDCDGWKYRKKCEHVKAVRALFAPEPIAHSEVADEAYEDEREIIICCPVFQCGVPCDLVKGEHADEWHCREHGFVTDDVEAECQ